MNGIRKYLHKKYLFPFFTGFLIFILVKTFFIDVAVVTSPGMEPALPKGSWYFFKRVFTPKRNDVVLVALPLTDTEKKNEKQKVLKRITGMPGDTVAIISSQVFINRKRIPENDRFLHNYMLKLQRSSDTTLFAETGIDTKYPIDDSCAYMLVLPNAGFKQLLSLNKFSRLEPTTEDSALYDPAVFPNHPSISWNKDFFGPLYIPRKGDSLLLDTLNFRLYGRLINEFEGGDLTLKNGKIIGGNTSGTSFYVFKQDYYFVTGDNFDSSIDSRQWGLVPATKLEGCLFDNK